MLIVETIVLKLMGPVFEHKTGCKPERLANISRKVKYIVDLTHFSLVMFSYNFYIQSNKMIHQYFVQKFKVNINEKKVTYLNFRCGIWQRVQLIIQ